MNLIKNVLSDPMKTGVVFGGGAVVSHFIIGLDLMVTGGIVVAGALLVLRARNNG